MKASFNEVIENSERVTMSRARRILIVDDESAIREMIVMALELAGYETLEAGDAKTAHAMVVDEQPDMMLLDWMMPGTSGIELAKRLRADPTTKDLPIIMLTAKAPKPQNPKSMAEKLVCICAAEEYLLGLLRAWRPWGRSKD